MTTVVRLVDRGRPVLPAELRRRLGLHAGEECLATIDEDTAVRLVPRRTAALAQRLALPALIADTAWTTADSPRT